MLDPDDTRDRSAHPSRRNRLWSAAAIIGAPLVAGCGRQSILSTRSKPAHDIALLWWWMLAAATVVFLGAIAMLVVAWWRRDRPGLPFFGEREDLSQGMVLVFGIAVPLVALVALFGVSDVYLVGQTAPPNPRTTKLTINVIGHQWWWEVRYGGGRVITANEIHIPVDTRVNVVATSADVIHSFWVPALNRKIDMVPGLRNRVLLYASQPGRVPGPVLAVLRAPARQHGPGGVRAAARRLPGVAARTRSGRRRPRRAARRPPGSSLFMNAQCASCHTIAGTRGAGHGRAQPHPCRLADLAGVRRDPQHADVAGGVDPQPAEDQARRSHAGPRAELAADRRAGRLPGASSR